MSHNAQFTMMQRGAHVARVRSVLASAVFTSVLILAVGCSAGGDVGTGPSSDPPASEPPGGTVDGVAGTFDLAAINSDPVPSLISEFDTGSEILRSYIVSGRVVLSPDSTYSITVTGQRNKVGGGTATETATGSGTYSFAPSEPGASNGVVTLFSSKGGSATVSATDISLTYETKVPALDGGEETLIWVYVRP
jgi:hypothetical protein